MFVCVSPFHPRLRSFVIYLFIFRCQNHDGRRCPLVYSPVFSHIHDPHPKQALTHSNINTITKIIVIVIRRCPGCTRTCSCQFFLFFRKRWMRPLARVTSPCHQPYWWNFPFSSPTNIGSAFEPLPPETIHPTPSPRAASRRFFAPVSRWGQGQTAKRLSKRECESNLFLLQRE